MMRTDHAYILYVFDLDGTLYDQPKLRLTMAMRLLSYYIRHPFRIRELIILQHFRQIRDEWTNNASDTAIYEKVAEDKGTTPEAVAGIVNRWIYDNPLTALRGARDEYLAGRIRKIRRDGRKVVVLSDYPSEDKLKALDIEVDGKYGPEDERIDELKPSPKGLYLIMQDYGVSPGDMLMIGDRDEKDGQCARAAGVDCLILDRRVRKRNYDEIGI